MYDLTVEEVHTFAVGDGDWVVHNECDQEIADLAVSNARAYAEQITNDTVLVGQNATAYRWQQWYTAGLTSTPSTIPPLPFYEAVINAEHIHFNLEYILDIPNINSYSDFIESGNQTNYNASINQRMRHTAHEMYIISISPFLCERTTFYKGYDADERPIVSTTAHIEICGGN